MPYGLLATGFVPKTYEIILEEIKAQRRADAGASLDLSLNTPEGQWAAMVAEVAASLWELGEAVNASQNRDAATGAALEGLTLLTGTIRPQATRSSVLETLTGTATTVIPAGSQIETSSGDVFETAADATLAALTAWANTTAYVVGDQRSNASRSYVCITAGTSAGSGGPTTTAADITDGTAHWRYMGEGTAAASVLCSALETGGIVATSGDLTSIVTAVGGWSSAINLLDADLGTDVASDEELRLLAEADIAAAGKGTPDAIRSDLLDVADVTTVRVFYNDTDTTDADGVPPHAVECLVQGGLDQDIFDQLLASVAAGIATYGTETGTAEDSEGNSHTVKFSRPTEITIYVDVTLIKDPDTYPTDGDDQVKAAIVAYGDAQNCGKDVVASRIAAAVFAVAGVLDVTDIDIGTSAAPTLGTTIAISTRELAVYDSSRITIATSDGTP